MIDFHKKYRKYYPILLLLSILLIFVGDSIDYETGKGLPAASLKKDAPKKNTEIKEGSGSETDKSHTHSDHDDPEKQRRMGIYHYNEGNKFFKKGDTQEAIANYKMAVHHDPENPDFYINLSTAYLKENNFEKAHETLLKLKTKSPKNPLLYYNLACYFSLRNEIASSKEALRKGAVLGFKDFNEIQTDPDLENLRKSKGFAHWLESIQGRSEIS